MIDPLIGVGSKPKPEVPRGDAYLNAARTLAAYEDDATRAGKLLEKSESEALTGVESRELSGLIASNRQIGRMLGRWTEPAPTSLEGNDEYLMSQFRVRCWRAHSRWEYLIGRHDDARSAPAPFLMQPQGPPETPRVPESQDPPAEPACRASFWTRMVVERIENQRKLFERGLGLNLEESHHSRSRYPAFNAIEIMDSIERDITGAMTLFDAWQSRMLCKEEWCALSHHVRFAQYGRAAMDRLWSRWELEELPGEFCREEAALVRWLSEAMAKKITINSRAAEDAPPIEVTSSTPATGPALRRRIDNRYVTEWGLPAASLSDPYTAPADSSQYRAHYIVPPEGPLAPWLTLRERVQSRLPHWHDTSKTILTDCQGQTLFAALRHPVCTSLFLDGEDLQQPHFRPAVNKLIGDLLITEGGSETAAHNRQQAIDSRYRSIRDDRSVAERDAAEMGARLRRNRARDVAATALAADPVKLREALATGSVELCLTSIVPVLGDGCPIPIPQYDQYEAFTELEKLSPIELHLRGDAGERREVQATIKVRQLWFVDAKDDRQAGHYWDSLRQSPFPSKTNDRNLTRLLGPALSPDLGGDASARADAMDVRLRALDARIPRLNRDLAAGRQSRGLSHSETLQTRGSIRSCRAEARSLRKDARALRCSGQQLKDMWRDSAFWNSGKKTHRMAARAAFLSHLMGEMPLLSGYRGCPLPKFVARVECEAKFLAAVAANANGYVPPVEHYALPELKAARKQFLNQIREHLRSFETTSVRMGAGTLRKF